MAWAKPTKFYMFTHFNFKCSLYNVVAYAYVLSINFQYFFIVIFINSCSVSNNKPLQIHSLL